MSEHTPTADLMAAIVRVLHNEGDGGIWEHFDRKNSEEVAATLAPALTAAGFGPVRAVEAERDAAAYKFEHAHKGANLYRDRAEQAEAREKALRESVAKDLVLLEFVGCQYWACEGPNKEPEDMVTCRVCYRVRRLRALLATSPDREDGARAQCASSHDGHPCGVCDREDGAQ